MENENDLKALTERYMELGCRSGDVKLKVLKTNIFLNPTQAYRVELVPDIAERVRELFSQFHNSGDEYDYNKESLCVGKCIPLTINLENGLVGNAKIILIKKGLDFKNRVYILAHEFGHMLWHFGLSQSIIKKSSSPYLLEREILREEDPNESFAMLCGNLGMYLRGYDLSTLSSSGPLPDLVNQDKRARGLVMKFLAN